MFSSRERTRLSPSFLITSEPSNKNYCCSEDISQQVTVTFTVIIFRIFCAIIIILLLIIFRIICGVCIIIFVVHQADKICLKFASFLNCHEIIISFFFQLFILFFSPSVLHACFAYFTPCFTPSLTLFFLFLIPHAGNLAHFPCLER